MFLSRGESGKHAKFIRARTSLPSGDAYSRSNSISLKFYPDDGTLERLRLFKDSVSLGDKVLIQRSGQHLLNALNALFGLDDEVTLELRGKRPSRRKSDPVTGKKKITSCTHGKYYPSKSTIALYMLTSTGRRVAYKTLFNTLLHEYCHHLDYNHPSLRLKTSLHTKGFYGRLNAMYVPLRDV